MKRGIIFLAVVFSLFFSSCEKEDYTKPVEVSFEFTMDSLQLNESPKSGSFTIDKGTLIVQTFEFDGRRDQGDDYYFTSEFSTPLRAELHNQNTNQNVSFDIPQGIYNRIEINLSLGDGNENALCLEGSFRRGPFDEVPILFEYAFQEQVRITARNKQDSEQIVLSTDNPVKATIRINVPNLFQFVNMNMIRNAEMVQENGVDVIKINNENNNSIFNLIATKLDNSIQVVFE